MTYEKYMDGIRPSAKFRARLEMRTAMEITRKHNHRFIYIAAAGAALICALVIFLITNSEKPDDTRTSVIAVSAPALNIAAEAKDELSKNAVSMTEERAKELAKKIDPDCKMYYVYPDGEGAWAYLMKGWNKDSSSRGSFWYITEDENFKLGEGDKNWSWEFIELKSMNIFKNSYGPSGNNTVKAATLIDGKPVFIEGAEKLTDINWFFDGITGMKNTENAMYNNVMLEIPLTVRVDEGVPRLYQVKGIEITQNMFLKASGAREILDALDEEGYDTVQIFMWRTDENIYYFGLNLVKGDYKAHLLCVYADGKMNTWQAWEGLATSDGHMKAYYDIDLPTIETVID